MHIKLDNLGYTFDGTKYIFRDLNFEDECQSLAIIGPSGGGKSTLLRIFGGLLFPNMGNFYFNHNLIDFKKHNEWHKRIGFVFQSNGLFPHLTGIQNILLPLVEVFNVPFDEANKKAYELLERFHLEKDAEKYPHQLSGGQQQRMAIIRALAVQPELLLLDEPTSALDPEYTSEVLNMINELTIEGQNIILVTHEMGFAKEACEKVMFLFNGNIEEYNDSKILFSAPQNKKLQLFLNKILEWN